MMAVVRYYGAKPDTPDPRDHSKVYSDLDIPGPYRSTVDLREYVDHVYNQEQLGSCTANAVCAAYGLNLTKQSQTLSEGFKYFTPSRLFLYYNTRAKEGSTGVDAGASIRDTVKSLNRVGVCRETYWPYDVRKFKLKPRDQCYGAAEGNNLCKYEHLTQNIDQLRACLKDNCPFVFGFNIYGNFDSHSNANIGDMPMPRAGESLEEKHAVMAVGYDDSKRRVIILNSWGSGWGDSGYFYMPYDFITDSDECFDFWKITFACERDKPRPKNTTTASAGYGNNCLPDLQKSAHPKNTTTTGWSSKDFSVLPLIPDLRKSPYPKNTTTAGWGSHGNKYGLPDVQKSSHPKNTTTAGWGSHGNFSVTTTTRFAKTTTPQEHHILRKPALHYSFK